MVKKQMTIDDLAVMVQKGFHETHAIMATKDDLRLLFDQIENVRADVHDIKITLGALVRTVAAHENEMADIRVRIARIERRAGIKS